MDVVGASEVQLLRLAVASSIFQFARLFVFMVEAIVVVVVDQLDLLAGKRCKVGCKCRLVG